MAIKLPNALLLTLALFYETGITIDLWNGYKTLVKKLVPNVQVVADKFQVMVQVNKELDTEKKREKRQIIEASKKNKFSPKNGR